MMLRFVCLAAGATQVAWAKTLAIEGATLKVLNGNGSVYEVCTTGACDATNLNIQGTIPTEIGACVDLTVLELDDNSLTGPIPTQLGDLVKLQELDLSENDLTGHVPSEIGRLNKLDQLRLFDNRLSGTIPQSLVFLGDLDHLELDGNELTGAIPTQVAYLYSLRVLELQDNRLTGAIPSELGNLPLFSVLRLSSNSLVGTIPTELASVGLTLDTLALDGNCFVGPLPTELGLMTDLNFLYLDDNAFTGPIPSELGTMADLDVLNLQNNRFVGTIPTELANLANLEHLQLAGNRFTGAFPAQICAAPPAGICDASCIPDLTGGACCSVGASCAPTPMPTRGPEQTAEKKGGLSSKAKKKRDTVILAAVFGTLGGLLFLAGLWFVSVILHEEQEKAEQKHRWRVRHPSMDKITHTARRSFGYGREWAGMREYDGPTRTGNPIARGHA